MQNDLFSVLKTIEDLCLGLVPMPYLDRAAACLSSFDDEYAPTFGFAKCGTAGYLQNVGSLPSYDARFNPITITQAGGRIYEIRNHIDALLFHSQRRNLGESGGLHQTYSRAQRMITTPALQLDRGTRLDTHRIRCEHVSHDFKVFGIPNNQKRRSRLYYPFTFLHDLQNAT